MKIIGATFCIAFVIPLYAMQSNSAKNPQDPYHNLRIFLIPHAATNNTQYVKIASLAENLEREAIIKLPHSKPKKRCCCTIS